MPIYEYKCTKCDNHCERFVKEPVVPGFPQCDTCGIPMVKVITAPRKSGVQFTGIKASASMRTKNNG